MVAMDATATNNGTQANYQYNIDGIRTSKTVNGQATHYLIDNTQAYAQVIAETDSLGSRLKTYLYGDDLISQTDSTNSTNTFHYDGLGSTRSLSDDSGEQSDSYDYLAFGEVRNKSGTTDNNYLYTGEQFDGDLDQYYLRARYYDQNVGRFTQQDEWMGRDGEPVTLNKYLYTHADPVNGVDPSGYFTLNGVMSAINIRASLGAINQVTARKALGRFLAGSSSKTTAAGAASGESSLGLFGSFIMQEMREAVIDTLFDYAVQGLDPFNPKSTFGTKAHTRLEKRIEKLNEKLDRMFKRKLALGITVKAEAFFEKGKVGKQGRRRQAGHFGIDVVIMQDGAVLKAFDLKTGGGWSKPESGRRAKALNSDLFQIYIVPKK